MFSFLALSTHKHPGKLKRGGERSAFLDFHTQGGLRVCHHVSELDVKFSKKHMLEIAITKETAMIKGSLMFKYCFVAQD